MSLTMQSAKAVMVAWAVAFLICACLGDGTLNRFDPSRALPDARSYLEMTRSGLRAPVPPLHHHRVLVPMLARPIYLAVAGRLFRWDAAAFALLVVNSVFESARRSPDRY